MVVESDAASVPPGSVSSVRRHAAVGAGAVRLDSVGLAEPDQVGRIYHSSYEILCFPEYNPNNQGRSFGGSIAKTNELIWTYFSDYSTQAFRDVLATYFNNVSDLKQDYEDRVANRVANVPEQWVGREFSIYFDGLSAATDRTDVENSQDSIMDLLDRAAPLLFLGLNKITYVYDNYLKIKPIGD